MWWVGQALGCALCVGVVPGVGARVVASGTRQGRSPRRELSARALLARGGVVGAELRGWVEVGVGFGWLANDCSGNITATTTAVTIKDMIQLNPGKDRII